MCVCAYLFIRLITCDDFGKHISKYDLPTEIEADSIQVGPQQWSVGLIACSGFEFSPGSEAKAIGYQVLLLYITLQTTPGNYHCPFCGWYHHQCYRIKLWCIKYLYMIVAKPCGFRLLNDPPTPSRWPIMPRSDNVKPWYLAQAHSGTVATKMNVYPSAQTWRTRKNVQLSTARHLIFHSAPYPLHGYGFQVGITEF